MQSGYSELMGMFPPQSPSKTNRLTEAQQHALSKGGVAFPPFGVRDSSATNNQLGDKPLPDGYISIPIFNHEEISMADDLDLEGCSYVNTVDAYRFPAESTYYSVEFLKEDLR